MLKNNEKFNTLSEKEQVAVRIILRLLLLMPLTIFFVILSAFAQSHRVLIAIMLFILYLVYNIIIMIVIGNSIDKNSENDIDENNENNMDKNNENVI